VRTLGWLLIAYSLLGVVLLVLALVVGGPMVARADGLASSAAGSMDAAAEAASAAADSFIGFDSSLEQAKASTDQAASLSRDAAGTLASLADAMSLNVLGAQPLLPLADDFRTTSDQMRQMGDNLEGIGAALTANREDVAAVGSQLAELAEQLDALRGGIGREQAGAGPPLSWLFYGFLLWQLLPITAAAVGGRLLLARARLAAAEDGDQPAAA
jgi:hypothetical protein